MTGAWHEIPARVRSRRHLHYNPVKHGYVARPLEWPYSSFRRYVEEGLYPEDWGSTEPVWTGDVGRE